MDAHPGLGAQDVGVDFSRPVVRRATLDEVWPRQRAMPVQLAGEAIPAAGVRNQPSVLVRTEREIQREHSGRECEERKEHDCFVP